ncbi:MAG: glutathione-disulfide reductase [Alphaproteobacteria bacterium]|nr:glutathione-disulfide reductase [Alphaproteobacteria bacterium]
MMAYDFDLFTIGAGSGGVASSRRAASYGARVAICEQGRVGGTCVLRGCIPKKLLVYAAHFTDEWQDAAGYGWHVAPPVHSWPELIAAKNKETTRLEGVYHKMLADAGAQLIEGHAKLIDAHTIEVNGKRLTSANILLAIGGHPVTPKIPGIEHVISSNEALDLPKLPRNIVIVGGGYIAVEFAGIFAGLGASVQMVIRGEELLNGFDDDVRIHLGREMRARGIAIHNRTEITAIKKQGANFSLATKAGGSLSADCVMYATGRLPNTTGMGLAEIGVALHPETGAIKVDDCSRTSVPNIYAIGDATDMLNLTPTAIAEGRALAETLFNNNPICARLEIVPTAVFSNPTIGTVGLTEAEARAQYAAIDVYRTVFRPLKNTLSGRAEKTLMKLVVDRASDKVLGAHMVGPDAPEIIGGLAVALTCGATKAQFDRTIGIHPTASEEFVTLRTKVPDLKAKAAE